ncbi:MAG: TetR/AcrR family transcriptional regulator [Spirochaetaceae bacterium]|nr:TetR/AcrR family transcriptional regulator [Spirochaetaceae bacterium]
MGSETRQRLIEAAIDLFSSKWYGMVSVAEICRSAGVSNGAFYRYFNNKEEIFRAILEHVVTSIERALRPVADLSQEQRLEAMVNNVFGFSRDHTMLVRVFREGQYRLFEFERRLKQVYLDTFLNVFGHVPSTAEYIYCFGGLRFASIRAAFHQIPVDVSVLADIIRDGMLHDEPLDAARVFSTSIRPLPIDLLPDSRSRLLRAGRNLFGEKGYFETNIHEVTAAAGLAIGSFYRHFRSKEEFYRELIHEVGKDVRHFISLNLDASLNMLEREMRGLWLFILFLSMDRNCYNIVREAEFVLPDDVRAYYGAFQQGYLKQPSIAALPGAVTRIEFMLGVAHYLGIDVLFEESPGMARSVIEELAYYYSHGLAGAGPVRRQT